MYGIEVMVAEHDNILKLLAALQNACCGILEGAEVDDGDFRKMIAFARNYADKYHHGKEEQLLFPEMAQRLGPVGANLIQHGMLVEHDLGRQHISELENALNQYRDDPKPLYKLRILTEAMGYANLLQRHIDKENQAVYPFAEKRLPEDVLQSIDEKVGQFEDAAENRKAQETYLGILQELTKKYAGHTAENYSHCNKRVRDLRARLFYAPPFCASRWSGIFQRQACGTDAIPSPASGRNSRYMIFEQKL